MKKIGLLSLLLLSAFWGCAKPPQEEKKESGKPPTAVEARKVSRGSLFREISASGITAGTREAYVISETQGKIRKVHFALGQRVEKGMMLLETEADVQEAALNQASEALRMAEMNWKATSELHGAGNASDAELASAQSQLSGAKAQVEMARRNLENCRIPAPLSGYITQKEPSLQPGNVLNPGVPVTHIVDLSSLKTRVWVGEREVALLRKGMKAQIQIPSSGETVFHGRVSGVSAGSDPSTGSYAVEVAWTNRRNSPVRAGMSVRVNITTRTPEQVVLIPTRALIEKENQDAVFLSVDEKAALRFVETGRFSGNHVEILQGISANDVLVTSGVTSLNRGDSLAFTLEPDEGKAP